MERRNNGNRISNKIDDPKYDVLAQDRRNEEAYRRLCLAVIKSAVKARDKRFFYSPSFDIYAPIDWDGPAIWQMIEKNIKNHGTSFAPGYDGEELNFTGAEYMKRRKLPDGRYETFRE